MVVQLSENDFAVDRDTLCLKTYRKPLLVMFYIKGDKNCVATEKILYTMRSHEVGFLDVTANRNVILMSQNTKSPITSVPNIIMFIAGKAYRVFNIKNKRTVQSFSAFISTCVESYSSMGPSYGNQGGYRPQAQPQQRWDMASQHAQQPVSHSGMRQSPTPNPNKAPLKVGSAQMSNNSHDKKIVHIMNQNIQLSRPDGLEPGNMPWIAADNQRNGHQF